MKKALTITTALLLILAIAGCSSGQRASDKAVSVGKQAIEVADQYLDGNTTYSTACDKLKELSEQMEYTEKMEFTDPDSDVSRGITAVWGAVLSDHSTGTSESYDALVEARNTLAGHVGEKKK